MHKLRHEPRTYEYLPLPAPMKEAQAQAQMQEREQAGLGILLLSMLAGLLRLPEVEEFSREDVQNENAPQSSLM
jgi:hypothetical protein